MLQLLEVHSGFYRSVRDFSRFPSKKIKEMGALLDSQEARTLPLCSYRHSRQSQQDKGRLIALLDVQIEIVQRYYETLYAYGYLF